MPAWRRPIIGFVSTGIGALAGGFVGHMFDGTVLPLALGFFGLSVAVARHRRRHRGAEPALPPGVVRQARM